ncbi:hypothetical protein VP01_1803g4 [Puccinia sorghi]|uniref:Uncharacterized protein n=1 Tax=Puccinia sorghi TaxID=27349 RepID=A0A0L6VEC5_9BASI|nr:hypothetical protein VP01_1803g4 [Puccinia sorghi]
MNFLKSLINHRKKRHPKTLQKEKEGHKTVRTSTPRAKPHQRKLQIRSNNTGSMPPSEMKFKNNDKGVELEEKKFNHSVTLEEEKWDHGIKLWKISLTEKEEKEKDRSFEMAHLKQLAPQEHIGIKV